MNEIVETVEAAYYPSSRENFYDVQILLAGTKV